MDAAVMPKDMNEASTSYEPAAGRSASITTSMIGAAVSSPTPRRSTSPAAAGWTMTDPVGIGYIRTLVEGAREYVRHTAVRRSDQLTTHHHGEADHLAWLDRPFAEALRALEERGRG